MSFYFGRLVEDGKTLLENLQEKVLVPVQSSRNKLVLEPCQNLPKSRSSVSSDMEHCQGPALWAYNDAVFTDKDFEDINS